MNNRLERMLNNIDDEFDKSEGSFFYDNLQAAAIEFDLQEEKIKKIIDKGFADTAKGTYLDRKVAEKGLIRKRATKASGIVKIIGQEGTKVEKGIKVATDLCNYTVLEERVIEKENFTTVKVECDQAGKIGNIPIGAIKYFPVTIAGLSKVENIEEFKNGFDEETDEELRKRYFEAVREPVTSGNIYAYKKWAKEINEVGDAKVKPLWNGPGTVKVIIVDRNKTEASEVLINKVKNYIDKQAPIGAQLTVTSAKSKSINIKVNLVLDGALNINVIKEKIQEKLESYFKNISFISNYVSYAKIGSLILTVDGVLDYNNLLVNSKKENINMGEDEICILGNLNIS
ncbi:baseplate J-like protein [Clostridium tepidiprofundi DSM 19306]|uniref:Baseplate J-like protein n=1 Tax=Clostridium tepidiprofundi DSM 19306 TaxID=1121338 RepID=A0A151B7C8_9CLOT|nr:baseplate J/gp47 family protein [Clostridium tepidiprofundi]KYH35825.1 baseplate J-like protein [Clostridium tepidiprofundi DSM 19306]